MIGRRIELIQFTETVLPGSLPHCQDLAELDGDRRPRFQDGRKIVLGDLVNDGAGQCFHLEDGESSCP